MFRINQNAMFNSVPQLISFSYVIEMVKQALQHARFKHSILPGKNH